MVKVSVIVPVYKVEKYIKKCLESIINQSFSDIEIIIVNDGTPDNSMKIVEKYLNDKRIKIINKENGGLSSARNAGMEVAEGEYLYFVDSDDWLENNAVEILYKNMNDEEIIYSGFYYYNEKNKKRKKEKFEYPFIENKGKYFLINGEEINAWNKLYKKSFLEKNSLKFTEGIIYEDLDFNIKAFFLAEKVRYIKECGYNYRVSREGSIMSELKIDRSIFSINEVIKNIEKFSLNSTDEFIKFRLFLEKTKLIIWKSNLLSERIEKKEFQDLEIKIRNKYEKIGAKGFKKEILNTEIRGVIGYSNVLKLVDIFNTFYWKNKILTFRLIRRILKRKIKI